MINSKYIPLQGETIMEELKYIWKITSASKRSTDTLSDVIIQTYWTVTGEDKDGNTGTFHGATPFVPEEVDAENFVPFSELTEETVIDWLKNIVVDSYWDHVNQHIIKEINESKYSVEELSADALPWAEPVEEDQLSEPDEEE